jgi:hypothetical protein
MSGNGVRAATPGGVDERAVAASGLMLPRLAAFGPSLHLSRLDSPFFPADPDAFTISWARLGRMLTAIFVGIVVLVAPMSALAYAADQIAEVSTATQRQHVPGGKDTSPIMEKELPPASSVPHP